MLAMAWLAGLPSGDWGEAPDTDGSVKRGWRFVRDPLGHRLPDMVVFPHYQVFGK